MLNKKPNFWIVAAVLVLLCAVGGRFIYQRHQVSVAREAAIESTVKIFARRGVMAPDDYRRILQIGDSITQTHSISDADLNWWIDFVDKPRSGTPIHAQLQRSLALSPDWRYLTNPTPQQRDRLYELSKKYLAPAPGSGLTIQDADFGLYLAAFLNEKRVAPLLTPFLQRSPQSDLRRTSEKLLKRWHRQAAA